MGSDAEYWDRLIRDRGAHAFDTFESDTAGVKAAEEIDRFLISRLDGVARGMILEIGCGRGRMTRLLAQTFEHVVALDCSAEAARYCRRDLADQRNVLVLLGDHHTVAAMPDHSFDVVFSYVTLQHVSNRAALRSYLASAARLVRKDGRAILQLRCPGWRSRVVDLASFARRAGSYMTWSRSWRGHVLSQYEIRRIVTASRPTATASTFPDAIVWGAPRHLWVQVDP